MKYILRNNYSNTVIPCDSWNELADTCKSIGIDVSTVIKAKREGRETISKWELLNEDDAKSNHIFNMWKKQQEENRVLVIGDLHEPFCLDGYLEFCKGIYDKYKCNKVVFLGDVIDGHSFSAHKASNKSCGVNSELELAISKIKKWHDTFPHAKVCSGNHECFDSETEVLTSEGWKLGVDLNDGDLVGSYNQSTDTIEFNNPLGIFKKNYTGKMYYLENIAHNIAVTPNHRMLYRLKNSNSFNFKINEMENIAKHHSVKFKVSANGHKTEDLKGISDDDLALLGWLFSDGGISSKNVRIIYQSKPKMVFRIRELLGRLGYEYREYKRDRDIKEICGKALHSSIPSYEFYIKCPSHILELFSERYKLPSMLNDLSDRQIRVFFQEYFLGDGSSKDKSDTLWKKQVVVDGNKTILDQLQILLIQRGFSANLRRYREHSYRLNVLDGVNSRGFYMKDLREREYSGTVWCAETVNDTLVVRRDGKVSIQGNCRLRVGNYKDLIIPDKVFKPISELLEAPTWDFAPEHIIDDVKYHHGIARNPKQEAQNDCRSVVAGHRHSEGYIHYFADSKGGIRFGMQVGAALDSNSYAAAYAKGSKPQHTNCGVVINGQGILEYMKLGEGK